MNTEELQQMIHINIPTLQKRRGVKRLQKCYVMYHNISNNLHVHLCSKDNDLKSLSGFELWDLYKVAVLLQLMCNET